MLHKVEDKRRLSKKIQEYLSKSPEVRSFPTAVTRLAAACQDPNANNHELASIIECDPALSVKILRLANSPLFSRSGEIKSIAHAVALLGLRKVKSLAISIAGASMFSIGGGAKRQRQQLWNHSVGCAVVARKLAKYVPGVDADDAFLAGVFHDVGKLLFYDVIPDEYSDIEASFDGVSLVEEEDHLTGTTHEVIGLRSSHSWGLPEEIKAAIGWHHRPEQASVCPGFASVIGVANSLAKNWGVGSETISRPELQAELKDDYGLTEEQLRVMETEARQAFEEIMTASVS
jgi:putative nucleotidyltransferase with HDIG domain